MYFYSLNWLWYVNATISCVYIWKRGGSGFYCSHHRFRLNFRIWKFRSCRKLLGAGPMSCIFNFFPSKSLKMCTIQLLKSIHNSRMPRCPITNAVNTNMDISKVLIQLQAYKARTNNIKPHVYPWKYQEIFCTALTNLIFFSIYTSKLHYKLDLNCTSKTSDKQFITSMNLYEILIRTLPSKWTKS